MALDLLKSFFTPEGLIAILLAIVIIAPYILFFFRKGIVKQLVEECGLATKKDMEANNAQHRKDMNAIRKALLLVAQQSIDDPERLERIKDLLTI